jgi:hypothetical protein
VEKIPFAKESRSDDMGHYCFEPKTAENAWEKTLPACEKCEDFKTHFRILNGVKAS